MPAILAALHLHQLHLLTQCFECDKNVRKTGLNDSWKRRVATRQRLRSAFRRVIKRLLSFQPFFDASIAFPKHPSFRSKAKARMPLTSSPMEREVSLKRCTCDDLSRYAVPKSLPLRTNKQHVRTTESDSMQRAKKKFHRLFPNGFRDETYLAWERDYKWEAHKEWETYLSANAFQNALNEHRYTDIAARAVRIESGRSLLFSFEKMALRDAVRETSGAKIFAEGLFALLHGNVPLKERFERWCLAVEALPRKQTRVLTWPLVTVFGFIAQPKMHIFLKPNTTKEAARVLGLNFNYVSRPNWETYAEYLALARDVRASIKEMHPRDMIDIQSFLWVQGSDEYR